MANPDDTDDDTDVLDDDEPDDLSQLCQFLAGVLSSEDLSTAQTLIENLLNGPFGSDNEIKRLGAKPGAGIAADRRITGVYTNMSTLDAVKQMQAIRAAEQAVEPFVGPVLGLDSAPAIYKTALQRMGHDARTLHPSACRVMFEALRHKGARPRMATDSATDAAMRARFPGVAALKLR
jgi:hypothetical protein